MDKLEKYLEEERSRRGYMDSCWSGIKRRLNLQSIGTYLRDGSEETSICYDSFYERESNAYLKLKNLLTGKYGEEETDQIMTEVHAYSGVLQEIYFNLGMKAGVILFNKLTDNFETDV